MSDLYTRVFNVNCLIEIFEKKIAKKKSKGIDKARPHIFARDLNKNIEDLLTKINNQSFSFSPYLEILLLKGRNRYPRVLSSPTVRDKLVLTALKEYLHVFFPNSVKTKLPNSFINDIKREIVNRDRYSHFFKTDVSSFYDRIDRNILYRHLVNSGIDPRILHLVKLAVENPTQVKNTQAKVFSKRGVPQGLPISNILAQIYLSRFDDQMKLNQRIAYYRYVDDILILSNGKPSILTYKLKFKLLLLRLRVNKLKTKIDLVDSGFSFLGYTFINRKATLSEVQISKFINKITARLASFKMGLDYPETRPLWLQNNDTLYTEVFLNEVNELITGAFSSKRRYGWLFYFIEVDDMSVLYRIDRIIKAQIIKVESLRSVELKSIVKSFFDIKYNNGRRYVQNYDDYKTINEKRNFLIHVGRLDPEKEYKPKEIEKMFYSYRISRLRKLEEDTGYY